MMATAHCMQAKDTHSPPRHSPSQPPYASVNVLAVCALYCFRVPHLTPLLTRPDVELDRGGGSRNPHEPRSPSSRRLFRGLISALESWRRDSRSCVVSLPARALLRLRSGPAPPPRRRAAREGAGPLGRADLRGCARGRGRRVRTRASMRWRRASRPAPRSSRPPRTRSCTGGLPPVRWRRRRGFTSHPAFSRACTQPATPLCCSWLALTASALHS